MAGNGTNTGPFAGAEPTGLTFTRRGVGVAEVHDGRITAYRDYFDRATMLSQIGRMDLAVTREASAKTPPSRAYLEMLPLIQNYRWNTPDCRAALALVHPRTNWITRALRGSR